MATRDRTRRLASIGVASLLLVCCSSGSGADELARPLEARLRQLRTRVPTRFEVPTGLRDANDANLVPTTQQVRALRRILGRTDKEPTHTRVDRGPRVDEAGAWRRFGEPSPILVERLRSSPEQRRAIAHLADGDHGTDTGATCVELVEALMFLAAGARAAPEHECMAAIVDALRVARAVQSLPRWCGVGEPPDEGWMLGSITEALVACSRASDDATRRRALEAFGRLDGAPAWPIAPLYLFTAFDARVADFERRAEQTLARGESIDTLQDEARALMSEADEIEDRLARQPVDLWRIPREERRHPLDNAAEMQLATYAHRQVLIAMMRSHAGEVPIPPDHPYASRFRVTEDQVSTDLIMPGLSPVTGRVFLVPLRDRGGREGAP